MQMVGFFETGCTDVCIKLKSRNTILGNMRNILFKTEKCEQMTMKETWLNEI